MVVAQEQGPEAMVETVDAEAAQTARHPPLEEPDRKARMEARGAQEAPTCRTVAAAVAETRKPELRATMEPARAGMEPRISVRPMQVAAVAAFMPQAARAEGQVGQVVAAREVKVADHPSLERQEQTDLAVAVAVAERAQAELDLQEAREAMESWSLPCRRAQESCLLTAIRRRFPLQSLDRIPSTRSPQVEACTHEQ